MVSFLCSRSPVIILKNAEEQVKVLARQRQNSLFGNDSPKWEQHHCASSYFFRSWLLSMSIKKHRIKRQKGKEERQFILVGNTLVNNVMLSDIHFQKHWRITATVLYHEDRFDSCVRVRGSASICISWRRIVNYYLTLLSELGVYKEVSSTNGWAALQIKLSTGSL